VIAAYPTWKRDEPLEVWLVGGSVSTTQCRERALTFAETSCATSRVDFPEVVHIGGDECPTTEWERSELAHAVMAELGFSDERQLQGSSPIG